VNSRYPWRKLDRPGAFFLWRNRADERSLRSQANKQAKRRGVVYSVERVGDKTLRVTLLRCLLK
jgi:hypothetical protein